MLELVGLGGFDVEASDLREVRYLRSPASGHARLESVLSFVARKAPWAEVDRSQPPAWAVLRHRPVPRMPASATGHPLLDRVASLIDGSRSVGDITQEMAGALPTDIDAQDATTALLLELHRRFG